ncbi:hypothetical protein [Nocardioides anomalus]|nr:hypothetical protein [Nocardioides anomalus]
MDRSKNSCDHGGMTYLRTLVRRFDAYTLRHFNPRDVRRGF